MSPRNPPGGSRVLGGAFLHSTGPVTSGPPNLHCPVGTGSPPATVGRQPIFAIGVGRPYPRIFTIQRAPEVGELLILVSKGKPNFSCAVKTIEEVGQALSIPSEFGELRVVSPFGDFKMFKGLLLWSSLEEINLYQELITQLAVEGYLDPARVGPKYDKITKLLALAEGGATSAEQDNCLKRAITMCHALLLEERKPQQP